MNIWTHFIGTILFISLLHVTFTIPVNTVSILQNEVIMTPTTSSECRTMDWKDILFDNFHHEGLCFETISPEDRIIEEFSYLSSYLSYSNHSQYLPNLTNAFSPLFSCFSSSTTCVLPEELLTSVKSSITSLISTLWDWIQNAASSSSNIDSSYVYNAVASAEALFSDLSTLVDIQKQATHSVNRWPIIVFICCAIWCLGGSTLYHQYYCTSFLMSNILQTIDYCGICILISGSYVPIIYYCFYCHPTSLWTHLTIVFVLNISNVCVMATPTFR